MNYREVICAGCGRNFFKDIRHINENLKLDYNNYCSLTCVGNSHKTAMEIICGNPECRKVFTRSTGNMSRHNFCSSSCFATVTNKLRAEVKICPNCHKKFFGQNKYCSSACVPTTPIFHTRNELISRIKNFYLQNKRIPLKSEFNSQFQAYRREFGSWNKAVMVAGFETNLPKFTHKYVAEDGHICDSLSEKIIDDWLFRKNILHQRGGYYPNQKVYKTDFLVKNKYWLEFAGLKGQLKTYDSNYRRKMKEIKKLGIKITEIEPSDLFPENKLSQKLNFLLNQDK